MDLHRSLRSMRSFGLAATGLATLLISTSPLIAAGTTRTCMFTKGRLIGERLTRWERDPVPIGSPCSDGFGSSGVAVAENEPREEEKAGPISVEEVLTTDHDLLDFAKVTALARQRDAFAAGANSTRPVEAAVAQLEAGALRWEIGEASRSGPDGGMSSICASFQEFQSAVDALRRAGPDADANLFDAQLRYAQVLAAGFWYCPTAQCDLVSTEAIKLAESGVETARRRGVPSLLARALTTLAEAHRTIIQRRESRGGPGKDSEFVLRECPTCEAVNVAPSRDEVTPRRMRALLEEAVRVEWAEGVWTRSLVESLVRLAALHREAQRSEIATAISGLAANGAAALALQPRDRLIAELSRTYDTNDPFSFKSSYQIVNFARAAPAGSGMRYVMMSRIRGVMSRTFAEAIARELGEDEPRVPASKSIDASDLPRLQRILSAVPVEVAVAAAPPASCDAARLRSTVAKYLEGERHALIAALGESSEKTFRWIMSALPAEDHLFDEVLRCGSRDQQVLQNVIERVLLRRQIWRFRLAHLSQARATEDPETLETLTQLTELRRRRAEQRLTRVKPPPSVDPLRWAICAKEETETGPDNEFLLIEKQIGDLEEKLMGEASPATVRNIERLWPDLLASLGTDAVLVGYLPAAGSGGRRIVAFVVDGQGTVSWQDVGSEAVIDEKFSSLARGGIVKNILRPAAETLIDPIEKHLQGKRSVLLLAAGAVRFLPWSALLDRNNQHLGNRFSISWLQWAGDAYAAGTDKPRSEVVFVAPQYEPAHDVKTWPRVVPPNFTALPWSAVEVDSLTKLLKIGGIRVAPLLGRAATERAVRKIANPTVLHIAAHGFRVSQEEPLAGDDEETARAAWFRGDRTHAPLVRKTDLEPSLARVGLAFAGANRVLPLEQGDDLLTAGEAADLDLRDTRLVVLSGCNTASPSLQDGSGAYDLALGFRMAGATSVVASLWPVADDASRLLMEEFYRALLDGLPVADALWRAKDTLRRNDQFSDPRFWAPFEAFGPNAVVWPKKKPGESVSSSGQARTPRDEQILILDQFADDRNHWQASGRRGIAAIRDGRYELHVEAGGWQFATIAVDIPEAQDFDLSCTVTKLSGEDASFFGFVFGFRDEDNYTKFTISGDGHISITSSGAAISLPHYLGEEPRKEINPSNATNVLRIVRTGKGVRFFANGAEVLAMPWQWEASSRLGFLVNQNLTIAFDDLKISNPGTAGH
jgi:CHAT domain-containing protein